jgi:hypothetical protein
MVNACPIPRISPGPDIMLPLAPPGPAVALAGGRDTCGTGVVMQSALDGR